MERPLVNDVWPRTVRSAGWCAVFLSQTVQGVALIGVMYGPVVCDPGSHAFVGVSRLSSNAAELNALMFAVRGVSVALQLEELGVPRLDTSLWGSCSSRREPWPIMLRRRWHGSGAGLRRMSSQRCFCTCVPTQELRAMNSQTWVRNWADGCSARAFLGYGRAFLQGRGCRDLPLRRAVVDGSAGQARPDDGAG